MARVYSYELIRSCNFKNGQILNLEYNGYSSQRVLFFRYNQSGISVQFSAKGPNGDFNYKTEFAVLVKYYEIQRIAEVDQLMPPVIEPDPEPESEPESDADAGAEIDIAPEVDDVPKVDNVLTVTPQTAIASNFTIPLNGLDYDTLPDMTGFMPKVLGGMGNSWFSNGYLLADRDLVLGEHVDVWVVRKADGHIVKTISLIATAETKGRLVWPKTLALAVNEDSNKVDGSVLLRAGRMGDDGVFGVADTTPTADEFARFDVIQQETVNRLWCYSEGYRVFTSAPFRSNFVRSLPLPSIDLSAGHGLCVQVRDLTTQRLYETHLFAMDCAGMLVKEWPTKLYDQLRENSRMLKLGAYSGTTIVAKTTNDIWVPQESALAVTVLPAKWLRHSGLSAKRALQADEKIYLWIHDDITGAPIEGSPLVFTPKAGELAKDQWPAALSKALKASPLSAYLTLGKDTEPGTSALATGADSGVWWQARYTAAYLDE